ncbi:MAG: hypothetical protein M0009_16900 [Deltaproteobacteria bacterium]|nr:hypothetical protein [Deltaproteobacteria bacterium]
MQDRSKSGRRWTRGLATGAAGLMFFFLATGALAADSNKQLLENGKFQVVSGSDDKAYLVDTVTGAVWVLTYRTLATGREPIAIPYKFIRNTPKNQGEFLVESAGMNTSMPYSSGPEK